MATSPLPSSVAKMRRHCYVIPVFSGIPNTKHGEKIRSGYLTPAFLGAQKGAGLLCNPCILGDLNTKQGEKIRSGYLTPAFLEAQKGAGLRRNPCILEDPQPQARGEN